MRMSDYVFTDCNTPGFPIKVVSREGFPLIGLNPEGFYDRLRIDGEKRVMAALDDEQVERIAERVVALLYDRDLAGRGG
jgi:hypothetical protein